MEGGTLPLQPSRSGSESSFAANLLALVLSLALAAVGYASGLTDPAELVLLVLFATFVSAVSLEGILFRKTGFPVRWRRKRTLSWRRVACREVALLATFAVIGFVYWLVPLFGGADMRKYYYPFLCLVVPLFLLLSVPYFCAVDVVNEEEEDVMCRLGAALLRRRRTVTRFELANYARSWLVKAFWLSLMQPGLVLRVKEILATPWDALGASPAKVFLLASACCYGVDLCYTAAGYLFGFRLFNTHIRTAEPTFLGWAVTLVCYWPFWSVLFGAYFFKYGGSVTWMTYFREGSAVWWTWAVAIVLLEALYALATVAAGLRFSNLTYRGLWDTGPYRWTKHPAYVFKNLSWWLVSMPFLFNGGAAAIRCSLLLLGLNFVYYLRAKTEERHLSHYPEYVAYALRMNRCGIFRWCARLCPALAYRAPTAAEDAARREGSDEGSNH